MENVKVWFSIPKAVALAEGSARYGTGEHSPNESELAELTADERAALGHYDTEGAPLYLATAAMPRWPAIVTALRSAIAAEAQKRAYEMATLRADWIAAKDCETTDDQGRVLMHYHWGRWEYTKIPDWKDPPPDVLARRQAYAEKRKADREAADAAEAAEKARRRAELAAAWIAADDDEVTADGKVLDCWNTQRRCWATHGDVVIDTPPDVLARRKAYAEAAQNAAEAYEKAARDAAREVARRYVIHNVETYKRAALDGKDVRSKAWTRICNSIAASLASATGCETVQAYGHASDHSCPTETAYKARDACVLPLKGIELKYATDDFGNHGDYLAIDRIFLRIVRVDTCPDENCKGGFRTCLEVTIRWLDPDADNDLIFLYCDDREQHVHRAYQDEDDDG